LSRTEPGTCCPAGPPEGRTGRRSSRGKHAATLLRSVLLGPVLLGPVLLGFSLLVAAACSGPPDRTAMSGSGSLPGREVFLEHGCAQCHGPDGHGSRTAPALDGLDQHWTPAALEAFLLDPRGSAASSPRLQALDERYLGAMPPVGGLSRDDLDALLAYLLSGPASGP